MAYGPLESIEFQGYPNIDREILKDISRLELGQTYQDLDLENAKTALIKWGIFKKVDIERSSDGKRVIFFLRKGFTIRDINISGNYPILEAQLRRALILHSGTIYDPSKLPEQINRMITFYEKEGFTGTKIIATEKYYDETNEIDLKFKIKKGNAFRLGKIEVEGSRPSMKTKIQNIIFSFTRFKPKQLKSDIEKVKNLYQSKKFYKAKIRVNGVEPDPQRELVHLRLKVNEGKRVYIQFDGNHKISDRILKTGISLKEDEDYDEYSLDHTLRNLKDIYYTYGFSDIHIEYSRTDLDEDALLVIYRINEGPQEKIKRILFSGNEVIKSDHLSEVMITQEESFFGRAYFVQPVFEEDLNNLENLMKSKGYLNAKVSDWKKEWNKFGDKIILSISIQEGPLHKINDIIFDANNTITSNLKIFKKLKTQKGEIFNANTLDEDVNTILRNLADFGYPYATVKTEVQELSKNQWQVTFKIQEGKKVKFGRIVHAGNIRTKEKTILSNLYIKEGDDFSALNIQKSQNALRRLGIFRSVSIQTTGLEEKKDIIHAFIKVEEKKSHTLDFELGYDTDTGFRSKLSYQKLNFLGRAKSLRLRLIAGEELQKGELSFINPRFLGSNFQFVSSVFAEREDRPSYKADSVGGSTAFIYDFSHSFSLFSQFRLEYINFNESITDPSLVVGSVKDQTLLESEIGLSYDRRDNFGDPRKGFYLSTRAEYTRDLFAGSFGFFKLSFNGGLWLSPHSRLTFANSIRFSHIIQVNGSSIPIDHLLFLGGDDTLRGFNQDAVDPAGGTTQFIHNAELQFRITNSIQLVAFVDSGILTNDLNQFTIDRFRHTAGLGIRYITPIGPIRLDYGFILDRQSNEDRGRLHFSFGWFF